MIYCFVCDENIGHIKNIGINFDNFEKKIKYIYFFVICMLII